MPSTWIYEVARTLQKGPTDDERRRPNKLSKVGWDIEEDPNRPTRDYHGVGTGTSTNHVYVMTMETNSHSFFMQQLWSNNCLENVPTKEASSLLCDDNLLLPR